MRLILALLFTVMGGAAWGDCVPTNVADCPGVVTYQGPVQVGNQTGPAPSPGDINITGSYKQNGVPISSGSAPLSAVGVTANAPIGSLPASAYIAQMPCRETAGHTVNVAVGSTSGASDVAPAFNVPAGGTTLATAQAFSKVWFSATAPQTLYLTPTNGSGFSLNCNLVFQVGP